MLLLRLLALSDFHGNGFAFAETSKLPSILNVDVVVISGDITHDDVESAKGLLSMFSGKGVPVMFVPGNMDSRALTANLNLKDVKCIHGVGEHYNDFVFVGLGGSTKTPFNSPFEYTEAEASSILRKASENLRVKRLILVSHCPPKNTKVDQAHANLHIGSVAVRAFIEEVKPILVVCGHAHEARGVDRVGETLIVNPGPAHQWFYAVVNVDSKVEAKLCRF